ncbi:MAG: DUF4198 domain-containing protein [Allorhizobium sp.]
MFEPNAKLSARPVRLFLASMASVLLFVLPATAHEFWIAADDYSVSQGEKISARLRVGQMMEGIELPWLSRQIRSFQYYAPDKPRDVVGREGDRPALVYEAKEPGLHIIAHETLPLEVTFDTMEEFSEYLEYEGLGQIVAAHHDRGLPQSGITEAYTRFAKTLVQVGSVQPDDQDRMLGLMFELTVLANPYAGDPVLPVVLTWQGSPEAEAQIAVFRELNGAVERTLITTGANGRAEIPLHKAGGRYLLNAVHIEPVSGDGPVWESSWASLTFEAPAR